jgi:hypothetical protein
MDTLGTNKYITQKMGLNIKPIRLRMMTDGKKNMMKELRKKSFHKTETE